MIGSVVLVVVVVSGAELCIVDDQNELGAAVDCEAAELGIVDCCNTVV